MRKKMKSLVLLTAVLFMFSCDKDEANSDNNGIGIVTQSVHVVASGFNETISPIGKSKARNIEDHITRLRYFVYTEYGTIIGEPYVQDQIDDTTTLLNDSFGKLDFELPTGKYTLVALGEARNEDGNYAAFDTNNTSRINDIRLVNFNKPGNVGDLFLKIQPLVVSNGINEVSVRLERSVGLLSVNINEAIPAGTSKIDILLSEDVYFYYFGEDRVDFVNSPTTYSFAIKPEQSGRFFSEKIHILNTIKPFSVTIVCTDTAGEVTASKTVHNIKIPKNTRVSLTSDSFFGGSPVHPTPGEVLVAINPWLEGTPIEAEL